MVQDKIIQILQEVYKYYPIGMPHLIRHFKGHEELKRKIDKKIREVSENEDTSWHRLYNNIKKQFSEFETFDFAFLQFPSCIMNIQLARKDSLDITHTQSLVLNISLLANYYTIFFEDLVTLKNQTFGKIPTATSFNIVYFESCLNETFIQKASVLKNIIELEYDKIEFMGHKLLFDNQIFGGRKFGDEDSETEKGYSIYEFLFDNGNPPSKIFR